MIFKKLIFPVLLVVAALAVSGCSKLPQETKQTAQTALEAAKTAEAETYATASWVAAKDAMTRAEAELEAQGKKMGLLRSYGEAGKILLEAQTLSEKALNEAIAAKELVRKETETVLKATRDDLLRTQEMLAAAPRGKDTRAEIESMQQELLGLQASLDAAADLAIAENFQLARAQIDQVGAKVAAIRSDLESALAKVKTSR